MSSQATEILIENIQLEFEDFAYRTPIKFGGVALDRATLLNVHCWVRTRSGQTAHGFGSMPLGNVWSFPSKKLPYDSTLAAMKALAQKIAATTLSAKVWGHPIEINHQLEPSYLREADDLTKQRNLEEPIPKLCTLVVASPVDAAIHDAFGKIHGVNCYQTYGRHYLDADLSRFLGPDFANLFLDQFILAQPKARMPLYHLVGALDPLDEADIVHAVGDGLPETLGAWIRFNGLTHLKIKLNGDDLAWDVDRVLRVDQTASHVQGERGVRSWHYSLDFNEKCKNVAYLVEFLAKIREHNAAAFERIQYIEQPTARDLKADRANRMHEASRIKPVVIDESLTDLESLLVAQEMGYTGTALKACKGQSQALLVAAAAQRLKMFLCVQDLTCPGASLIHSAGLAAHVPGVAAIEANARQYMPQANEPWAARFPGLFDINDGMMTTANLTGPGLGAWDETPGAWKESQ